jgi:Domain of unknown function (DUF4145)
MVSTGTNWTCPYCGHAQVLSHDRLAQGWDRLHVSEVKNDDDLALGRIAIVCANDKCRELNLRVFLGSYGKGGTKYVDGAGRQSVRTLQEWTLLPPSSAKPQPDVIPKPIREDYYEACAIRDLSPKASATITRRCLQGMIRDFCKIRKKRLVDEIAELRKQVESGHGPPGVLLDSIDAIDGVRKIGNIGAHMEADINFIVDVDPNEAQALIGLIEALFSEWYIAAAARKARLGRVTAIAADKKPKKKPTAEEPAPQPPTPSNAVLKLAPRLK